MVRKFLRKISFLARYLRINITIISAFTLRFYLKKKDLREIIPSLSPKKTYLIAREKMNINICDISTG